MSNSILIPPARAFIFDMDGTLVDNMSYHVLAWEKVLASLDIYMDREKLYLEIQGRVNEEIVPHFIGNRVSPELEFEYGERKESLYRELYLPHLKPIAGLPLFLEKVRQNGIVMAIGTAACPTNTDFILDSLNIRPYYQAIVTSAEIQHGKPDPEIFLLAAQQLGVQPADCLVFEDALAGLEAARRAGMPAIALTTTHSAHEIKQHYPGTHTTTDYTTLMAESQFSLN